AVEDAAAIGRLEPGNQVEKRGFPGARGPRDRGCLAAEQVAIEMEFVAAKGQADIVQKDAGCGLNVLHARSCLCPGQPSRAWSAPGKSFPGSGPARPHPRCGSWITGCIAAMEGW